MPRKPKPGFLKQTFEARQFPQVIVMPTGDMSETEVVGPFCVHCGNPFSLHGPDARCPNQHLHPLFPPPRLPYAS